MKKKNSNHTCLSLYDSALSLQHIIIVVPFIIQVYVQYFT